MPHSTQDSFDSKSNYSERPMTSNSKGPGSDIVGTAISANRQNSDNPVSPIAAAYEDLVGGRDHMNDVSEDAPGGRRDAAKHKSEYGSNKQKTQYFEEQFQYKDNTVGTARERVHRESPVIAELRTNVIIKDEFTLVTDLSYHLAARFTRPDSSIMINVDHSSCLALAGTFEPCYILTLTALPSQMQPTTNKRNAALIQSFMADILSVSPDRGIVKFVPIAEEDYAMNGSTMLGEIERLEKQGADDNASSVKRAFTNGRKSMTFSKSKPAAKVDSGVATGTTLERKRSMSITPPIALPVANIFELPATAIVSETPTERPSTANGMYDGLRMNGISRDALVGDAAKAPNGRPKTFAGQAVSKPDSEPLPMPRMKTSSPDLRKSPTPTDKPDAKASTALTAAKAATGNIPISPRPTTSSGATSEARKNADLTSRKGDTYLDNVSTSIKKPEPLAGKQHSKDPAANAAKRRSMSAQPRSGASNMTATPKLPPPPPIPDSRAPKVSKRKSFLSAFRSR